MWIFRSPNVEKMKRSLSWLMVVAIILTLSLIFLGCGGSTALTVEAPSGVEVESASINSDWTLNCKFYTSRDGNLKFSLDCERVVTSEDNPNIISGSFTMVETLSFTKEVEADNEYDISVQFDSKIGDISWGTLALEFE